ncbi:MAG: hypothetical protein V4736_04880 [Bdellovibrionota bacterium]
MSKAVEEKSLERMEALLSHSALGVHVLFDNQAIANVLKNVKDDADFYDFEKMKRVQDVMTELVAKPTYIEKVNYVKSLDSESFRMLIRAYFHIVENTVRQTEVNH